MFSLKEGWIIYINKTENYKYEYKSYIKYKKYKYIEFWDTVNLIQTKTIDYTQE